MIARKNIYITTIAFTFFFIAGCNGNSSSTDNKKKTDTVYIQPNSQGGEGIDGNHGGGRGDDNRGMDSMRHGMGHNGMGPNGMDTIHRKRHE